MASLRKRIDQMCKACVYDSRAEGTWRAQVERCTCISCPLYDVRPVPQSAIEERREEKRTQAA